MGMAREVYEEFASARRVFRTASRTLGYSMESLCFEEGDRLNLTEYTQPALVTASCAVLAAVHETMNLPVDAAAGLSLGEYSALVCAGAVDFATAVMLVSKRGRFMQEACPAGAGTMATVLGLDRDSVIDICLDVQKAGAGIVEPANFNCPGQIVIAGEVKAVERAMELCKEKGARRTIKLPVSAPFHCKMLKPAGEKLAAELEKITFSDLKIPVVSNVTAEYNKDKSKIKDLLIRQVSSPVKWEESIVKMIENKVDTFVEIGPGKVLSSFIKKIDKSVKVLNVEDIESLNKTICEIGDR